MIDGIKWLTDSIPVGKSKAVSAEELSRKLEIGKRDLRQMIEDARRAGALICGDNHGYYFPASEDEITDYIHRVRSRIRTSCVCLAPFIRRIKEPEGSSNL